MFKLKKKLYPNEYAEIVLFIFFLYSWGHSLNKIAFLLNEANIPSPKGKLWGSSTIENIIKNPVYSGNLVWQVPKFKDGENKFFFPNTHTAIANTHFTQLHKLNKQLQQKFGRFDTIFLFLNKIQCAHCNQVLSTQNGSTKRNGLKYEYLHYVCKKCNYKIDARDLDLNLIPLIMNKVHSLVLNEKFKISTLELLVEMVKVAKDQIGLKNEEIKILSKKLMLSKELDDYELQQYISSSIERHNNEVETLERCIENINALFETVNQNFFFSRFKNILINDMDSIETRLIILYFVDLVELTTDNNFNIRYKTNIFEELDIG